MRRNNCDCAAKSRDCAAIISIAIEAKDNAREDFRGLMSAMNMIARSMAYQFPGVDETFKMPRNRTDADLLAAGRAFWVNSAAFEAAFINYGMAADFRDTLNDAANNFEGVMQQVATALADRVEAGAELLDWVVQGMRERRILDGIVRVKYKNNPGKLAAWDSASHIEAAPAKKKPPTP